MSKRAAPFIAVILLALLLSACGSANPSPTATPLQTTPGTSAPPSAAPAESTAPPTASPAPSPTAAEPPAAGLGIGTFLAADDAAYYCVKVNQIVRLDRATMAETTLRELSEVFNIYSIFLDGNGSLYYLCGEAESDDCSNTLYRLNEAQDDDVQDFVLAENVAFVLRATGSDIYYLDDEGQICRYAIASGEVKQTGMTGFDLVAPLAVSDEFPFFIVQKYEDAGGNRLFRYSYEDGKLAEIAKAEDGCVATDDGRYLLIYTVDDENVVSKATLYDIEAGKPALDGLDMSGLQCGGVKSALVRDGKLYLVTESASDYKVRRVDMASRGVEDVLTIENAGYYGNLRTAAYGGGKWLLYHETVTAGTAEDPKEVTPKVGVLDLGGHTLAYAGEFPARAFDPAHQAGIFVIGDYLFLCEDRSIYSPNTGEYLYSGYVDLSGGAR